VDLNPWRTGGFVRHWRYLLGGVAVSPATQDVTGLLLAGREGEMEKRGGTQTRVTPHEALASSGPRALDLIMLDTLTEPAGRDPAPVED
jgi:hypothetical protein